MVAQRLDAGHQRLLQHSAIHHPLFSYLKRICSQPAHLRDPQLLSTQARIYRDNFLLRTQNTVQSVIKLVAAAGRARDWRTLSSATKNLFEETGEGRAAHCHIHLLLGSHNVHFSTVFGLTPVGQLQDVASSDVILPHTHRFLQVQNELYESQQYLQVLGASYAQEMAAEPMLTAFKETLFLPFKEHYHASTDAWQRVMTYYDVHLNGVEEEHGLEARRAVESNCSSEADAVVALDAADRFLSAQSSLWGGMLEALQASDAQNNRDDPAPLFGAFGRTFNQRSAHRVAA